MTLDILLSASKEEINGIGKSFAFLSTLLHIIQSFIALNKNKIHTQFIDLCVVFFRASSYAYMCLRKNI
jgi:hypothetical protein